MKVAILTAALNQGLLAEVILGEMSLAAAVQDSGVENLSVLTAGGHRENPSELLAGPGVKEFFRIRSGNQ
jgi:hypothetical protein